MFYIQSLLSPRSKSTQGALVNKLLEKVNVFGRHELAPNYAQSMVNTLHSSPDPQKLIQRLLQKIQQLQQPEEIAKYLTLLHGTISSMHYEGVLLQALGDLHLEGDLQIKADKNGWFSSFYKAYVTYLVRLPSVRQVYIRAKEGDVQKMSCQQLLVDLFRVVNQVGLFKDTLNLAFNTIGRYYQSSIKIYRALYDVLWQQLNCLYEYLRKAINFIFQHYTLIHSELLKIFTCSVKQVELMADRVEDFMMNKYFSKTKVQHRLYFQPEQLSKIEYHIRKISKKQNKQNSEQNVQQE